MPKDSSTSRKLHRHDPLEKQIRQSRNPGILSQKFIYRQPKSDESDEEFLPKSLSRKVLQQAKLQRDEIAAEEKDLSMSSSRQSQDRLFALQDDDNDDYEMFPDPVMHEQIELSAEDERALELFMPSSSRPRLNLADLVLAKIREKEQANDPEQALRKKLDPKVVEVFVDVGKILSSYKSGKVPKAVRIIPKLRNWEEILFLTNPDRWTSNAVFAVTRIFATCFNTKIAERFYSLILLDRIRKNIEKHKRLNFHLFQSLRKALFRPAAFFKGLLLPLTESECTAREAVILASILAKMSIPVLHSAAAMLMLVQMPYSGPQMLFLKTLFNKKYALPRSVLADVLKYFFTFKSDERDMPVIWHQTVLVFVQRYKLSLSIAQREALGSVLKRQHHHSITAEIRRELFSAAIPMIDATSNRGDAQMKIS
uniref:Bystin n=1 Tax=Hirondellea gigas TaxID=1518452 RepID=A0A6A7G2T5_9CRUS